MSVARSIGKYIRFMHMITQEYRAAKTPDDNVETLLHMLETGLLERRDKLLDEISRCVLSHVADMYASCKKYQFDHLGPYQIGGEWAGYVSEHSESYQSLQRQDHKEIRELLTNFWRNDLAPIVANYDYYSNLVRGHRRTRINFVSKMLKDYEIWEHYVCDDVTRLCAPTFGNAWGLYIKDTLVVPQAFRFHRNATFILELLETVRRPVVAEIGGGYGGMAYYLLSQKKDLVYIGFDIPETLFIAAFYLGKSFPGRKIFWFSEPCYLSADLLRQYDIILMPHYMLPRLADHSVDLFHNAISMSEMSFDTISEYMRQIHRTARQYFYHVNIDKTGIMKRGHERVPGSRFPIDTTVFRKLFRIYDPYFGPTGAYCEFLYQRIWKGLL